MIDFIDLKTQQARLKDRIDAGIQRVLAHGQYILGPEVAELEEKLAAYCGAQALHQRRQWHRCAADRLDGAWCGSGR